MHDSAQERARSQHEPRCTELAAIEHAHSGRVRSSRAYAPEVRDVALGPAKGDIVVIESGVEAGESVIVEGLQKVRSDMVVEPKPAPPSNSAPPLMED